MASAERSHASLQRRFIWLLIGGGVLAFGGATMHSAYVVSVANWHLVYVATTSQTECVQHARLGAAAKGGFSAATSSCTPR